MNIDTPQPGPPGAEAPVPASDAWPDETITVRELPPSPPSTEPSTKDSGQRATAKGDWKWFVAAAVVAAAFTAGAFVAANDSAEPETPANAVPAWCMSTVPR